MRDPLFVQPELLSVPLPVSEPSPTPNKLPSENNLLAPDHSPNPFEHPSSDASDPDRYSLSGENESDINELTVTELTSPNQPEETSEPAFHQTFVQERLDASSLSTVLDMLTVIDTVEELALLETLTETQKRQVWDATPEAIRTKLKQLRAAANTNPSPSHEEERSQQLPQQLSQQLSQQLDEENDEENESFGEWDAEQEAIELGSYSLETNYPTHQPTLHPKDWVVLHANPKLTPTELNAIWEVVEVHRNIARIHSKAVGTRNYPIAWMTLYPKPKFD